MAIHNANLGTYMPTNPTVVQLHVKMHGFHCMDSMGKHTFRVQCMQNTQEISGAGLSGQAPHSHIGDPNVRKTRGNLRGRTFRPSTAQPHRRTQMYAKHEGIPGAGFSGQVPHSHIGGPKCTQNTAENHRARLLRPATAQPYRKAQLYAKYRRKPPRPATPASYRTAI